MQKSETDEIDKMDKVQDISSTTFVISITQMFFLSGYALFNVCLFNFVCAAVSLFLITLKKAYIYEPSTWAH